MENKNALSRARALPLAALCVFTYLCNLFDYAYTLYGLRHWAGLREENPVFAALLRTPALAAAFKLVGVGGFLWLLYRMRAYRSARLGIVCVAAAYAAVVVYELLLALVILA